MKLKMKNGRHGARLTGEASANEELIYAEAECVKAGCDETLLAFSYEQKKKGCSFDYYVGTARPIEDVLRDPIPRDYYEAMLASFIRLAQACDSRGLSIQRVSYDLDTIFFDPARYALRFAYMPMRGDTEHISSPLQAIERISERAIFDEPGMERVAEAVVDFTRRSAIFSWIEFEALLRANGVLEGTAHKGAEGEGHARQEAYLDRRDCYGYDFIALAQKAEGNAPREASQAQGASDPEPSGLGEEAAGGRDADCAPQERRFALVRVFDAMEWALSEGETLLGVLPECDIVMDASEGASRKHAVLMVEEGACRIRDLGSTNGVAVNGEPIEADMPVPLEPGDHVQIARTLFELRTG